jgi:hypothetical protein
MNNKIIVEWTKVCIAGVFCGAIFLLSLVVSTTFERAYTIKKCTEAGLHQEVSGSQVIWTSNNYQPPVVPKGQPTTVANINGRSINVYSDGTVTTSPPP